MKRNRVYRCYIFFFKQKTAYEMRISDWSSDVCSSDLADHPTDRELGLGQGEQHQEQEDPGHADLEVVPQLGGGERDRRVALHEPEDHRPEIGRAACRERECQYG